MKLFEILLVKLEPNAVERVPVADKPVPPHANEPLPDDVIT